jgi:uncharacterized membrane protein
MIRGAFIYFFINFAIIMIAGLLFFRSEVNFSGIVRAVVIASASAFAWFLVYYRERKKGKG